MPIGRLFRTAKQLIPSFWWATFHFIAVLLVSTAVAFGLQPDGEQNAKLWGLHLRFPGLRAMQKMANCSVEMHQHAWTLLTLPMTCFVITKPVVRSLRPDFMQFLRFSSGSPLIVEVARVVAIATGVVLLLLPYVVGVALTRYILGPSLGSIADVLSSTIACTVFVCTLLYALASIGLPTEYVTGGSIATPFLLSGMSEFFQRSGAETAVSLLPPGLPYTTNGFTGSQMQAAVIIAVATIVVRFICAASARTLRDTEHLAMSWKM